MKAIIYSQYGRPEDLRLAEVPRPEPAADEVLIKVKAAAVNSWDWDRVRGKPILARLESGLRKPRRQILGADVAGTVVAAGGEVTQWQVGDRVFGDISGCHWGGFAEYALARAAVLARIPDGMDFAEAAAIPQAGVLALQGLRQGQLAAGRHVLINGAGGGVGTFAVQMAKAAGAEVTAVDHGSKLEGLRALGADHLIDYTQMPYTANGRQYDLILDNVANQTFGAYRNALRPGGHFVMVGGRTRTILTVLLRGALGGGADKKHLGLLLHKPNAADLEVLKARIAAGEVKPIIGHRFPLAETGAAIRLLGEGKAWGKVVIAVERT